ncbi:MAG: signal peptidase II [Bacilli bacterium]|nr:signal peptidase II [Bacilli bacterium]
MNKKVCILGIVIILLDQISKNIISSILSLGKSIKVIKDFFYLTYVHNFGGAWSIFNNRVPLLVIATFVIIFILIKYMDKFKINKRNALAFGLLFGGIISNLIDRICFGYVKDFLDFKIFNYNYPVFNIADIAIVVGVFLMIIAIIKGEDKNGTSSN